MLFTVTTVKDTVANLERFVSRNLAGGVDHLFVFVDAPDAEVEAYLAAHPHVTHVVCDDAYWGGSRPVDLNVRQVTNSNLVNCALAPFGWARWLFHIDADEVVEIDRQRLLGEVPPDEVSLRLGSLEAVSQPHWDGDVTHFKRLLKPEELELLVALDVIPEPDNKEYFRGHTHGKLGVRPGLERRLQLHRVVAADGTPLPQHKARWLRVLHYESYDGEEFVRKWMAHVSAGTLRFRPSRERLLTALTALVSIPGMDEETRHRYLMRLYDRWVKDDLETLQDLGLLVRPRTGSHVPEAFPSGGREQMESLFGALVGAEKVYPPERDTAAMIDLVARVGASLPGPVSGLVASEVARARGGAAPGPGEGRLAGLAGRFGRGSGRSG